MIPFLSSHVVQTRHKKATCHKIQQEKIEGDANSPYLDARDENIINKSLLFTKKKTSFTNHPTSPLNVIQD